MSNTDHFYVDDILNDSEFYNSIRNKQIICISNGVVFCPDDFKHDSVLSKQFKGLQFMVVETYYKSKEPVKEPAKSQLLITHVPTGKTWLIDPCDEDFNDNFITDLYNMKADEKVTFKGVINDKSIVIPNKIFADCVVQVQ